MHCGSHVKHPLMSTIFPAMFSSLFHSGPSTGLLSLIPLVVQSPQFPASMAAHFAYKSHSAMGKLPVPAFVPLGLRNLCRARRGCCPILTGSKKWENGVRALTTVTVAAAHFHWWSARDSVRHRKLKDNLLTESDEETEGVIESTSPF